MRLSRPRFSTRTLRRLFVLAPAVVLLAAGWLGVGHLLVRADPLAQADAIYVLGGAWTNRWLDAVDLYHQGWAPLVLLSKGSRESGERLLDARGVHVPDAAEIGRDVMVRQLGLPESAVEILLDDVDSTAREADVIRDRAKRAGWHAVIVITDPAATRRAGVIFQRKLGASIRVIMRSPGLERFDAAHGWPRRADLRRVFFEAPKLVVYWLGLAG